MINDEIMTDATKVNKTITERANYMNKFRLDGQVAVVCGGLGLIGKEVSLALAQAGAKVLVLDIDEEKGVNFADECSKQGLNVKFIYFNIGQTSDFDITIPKLFAEQGPFNVWVNVAYPRTEDWGKKLEHTKASSWQKNVDLQMNSYCLTTREVAELMKKHNIQGNIINFGSTYGVVSPDFEVYSGTDMTSDATYAAIKGGIIQFSRYAASYYGKYGIRFNCLCPGGVFDNQNDLFHEQYKKRTPLRRMAKAEEIASATLFLASDASSYITGSTFMVDGGWTCI